MDINKNYYATLGVLPTAQDIVIRAAYKALAQRYHPDRYEGPTDEANRLMEEINEAYKILSDLTSKAEYDKQRKHTGRAEDGYFEEAPNDEPPRYDPLSSDWELVLKYYPDLKEIESRLARISWRLAYAYRSSILELKNFEERQDIADALESQFMELYFGTHPTIVNFAKGLIQSGHKEAARALNKAVNLFGKNINPHVVIPIIEKDFNTIDPETERTIKEIRELMRHISYARSRGRTTRDGEILLIQRLGGRFVRETGSFFARSCRVVLGEIDLRFHNISGFENWVVQDLIPQFSSLTDSALAQLLKKANF